MENDTNTNVAKIISESKKELENMPYYNDFNKKYDILSNEFKDTLTKSQISAFNEIIKLFSTIKNYESYIAYRVGYEDGVKYKNISNDDPNHCPTSTLEELGHDDAP